MTTDDIQVLHKIQYYIDIRIILVYECDIKYEITSIFAFQIYQTRLSPVIGNVHYTYSIVRSAAKDNVQLYDTTPVQVISLSVTMSGRSPRPSQQSPHNGKIINHP